MNRRRMVLLPQRLAMDSQSLSIALVDLDDDSQVDIWVANDFDLPDFIWLRHNQRWDVADPFLQTPHSTMSTEWGFIANDKRLALFSTDMMPYDHSAETMAAWQPVMDGMMGDMEDMEMHHDPADPQIMANVLQMPQGDLGQSKPNAEALMLQVGPGVRSLATWTWMGFLTSIL